MVAMILLHAMDVKEYEGFCFSNSSISLKIFERQLIDYYALQTS